MLYMQFFPEIWNIINLTKIITATCNGPQR